MSSEKQIEFTKDNIDTYLKEVAKEYRKQTGKNMPAEMILIGGASVLVNYGFRDMTTDIDAVIRAASAMKDVINYVGDRFHLPIGWLNQDFIRTESYSPSLSSFSEYYRTYSNVLTIRTVAAEYLIAMKLRSGRQYKSDLSDVLGILAEHEKNGTPITLDRIRKAVSDLYGDWDSLPETSQNFITNAMQNGHFSELYAQTVKGEKETKNLLLHFEQDYPGLTKEANVNEIAENLRRKTNRASVLAQLRKKKAAEEKPSLLLPPAFFPHAAMNRPRWTALTPIPMSSSSVFPAASAMAAIPNMRVYLPSDRHQTKHLIESLLQDEKCAYIRVAGGEHPRCKEKSRMP